ncbi:MAG: hypothetical protein ACJAYG_000975 [Oceanicoccus sp.]
MAENATAEINAGLRAIEDELRQLHLWQLEPPSAASLASKSPFSIDTLTFPQWLQFVFIARLHPLIERQEPLSIDCQIAPMAEQYFGIGNQQALSLLRVITALDGLLSRR